MTSILSQVKVAIGEHNTCDGVTNEGGESLILLDWELSSSSPSPPSSSPSTSSSSPSSSPGSSGSWISAKRVINHPNYGNHDNDIAVLEVTSNINSLVTNILVTNILVTNMPSRQPSRPLTQTATFLRIQTKDTPNTPSPASSASFVKK